MADPYPPTPGAALVARLVWAKHPNTLAVAIGRLPHAVLGRLEQRLQARAIQAEAHVKVSAPWSDRTGAARNGIRGTAEVTAGRAELVVSHAVDYGVWLELANHGRYAAIIPQMALTLADVKGDLRGLL